MQLSSLPHAGRLPDRPAARQLSPLPHAGRLPDRPDALLVLRLARLHEQLPQPGHLHHLQRATRLVNYISIN